MAHARLNVSIAERLHRIDVVSRDLEREIDRDDALKSERTLRMAAAINAAIARVIHDLQSVCGQP